MSLQVHLTFDYELFFGSYSGTAEKCLLEPTKKLIELSEKHHAYLTFFVDAGYLYQLEKHQYDAGCKAILKNVNAQLQELVTKGHEIGLHIHPHWEDSFFKNGQWYLNTRRYKLSDFSKEEVLDIFDRYHKVLKQITGRPCQSYRAGGWCIQPFSHIREALMTQQIFTDSSVYQNGYHQFSAHAYDFRKAPDQSEWQFETNECEPVSNGHFTELAITPNRLSPLFYWNLYFKMRSNPAYYKPIGDGSWLKDKKKIYRQFYAPTNHFACCDGYFASQLIPCFNNLIEQGKKRMVVLGHPKSLAAYSFDALEDFITHTQSMHAECVTLTKQ
jgi:peptidoglycan/xylan/chitin deacetylase (PgdA/CDA1 family)